MEKYDVIIVGAGPCGIYGAYELIKKNSLAGIITTQKQICDNISLPST